jgi:two-component system, sensor histidine kinase
MAKRKARKRPRRRRRTSRSRPPKTATSRAVEAVLAGIAHDIRTPLTGIVALAELLATSDIGKREREWARTIKSGADHLAALTTLIVDAAKAAAAGLVLRREPFSPRELAHSVGGALKAQAGNKGISVDASIAADLPAMVTGDALRLRSVLENLVDNAVKFTQEGTVVFSVTAIPAGHSHLRLVFTMADSGIGMTPREIKSLFRPFAQANEQIARRYGGAGLGLTFVKRITEAMGGELAVSSKPRRGTTFRLEVPVERVEVPPAAERSGVPAGRSQALAILCAEDNPYGRVVMNTILTELGHRVDFVETGDAVVEAAKRGGYDAVLMDVALSGLDGIEATRRIRTLAGKAGQVAVIGISGRSGGADEQAARAAGMNFYFVKPAGPGKLAQALNSITERPRENGDPVC